MTRNKETTRLAASAPELSAPHSAPPYEDEATAEPELVTQVEGDTLHLRGDIDLYQADRFRQQAEAHIQRTQQPRLDLTEVPFLDSAGLAVLIALSRQAKEDGKTLRLAITGSPRRVLRITGIDKLLVPEE